MCTEPGASGAIPRREIRLTIRWDSGRRGMSFASTTDVRVVRDAVVSGMGQPHPEGLPDDSRLYQNYPNPFNPSTTLSFRLDQPGRATVRIFNLLGEEIDTPLDEVLSQGRHSLTWNAGSEPSGTYYYRLELAGTPVETRSMMLLR